MNSFQTDNSESVQKRMRHIPDILNIKVNIQEMYEVLSSYIPGDLFRKRSLAPVNPCRIVTSWKSECMIGYYDDILL